MALTLPSGKPNPYTAAQNNQNPWAKMNLDPTKKQASGLSGSLDQAQQGLGYAAKQGWGKTLGDQDYQRMAQVVGYKGGNVTGDQYNAALDWMGKEYGAQGQQAPDGVGQPSPQPGQVGPQGAINQWAQQAPVAGVPQSFRGSNPYAQQQQSLMSGMLANPHTMGQQQQQQMNEAQKETAAKMMQQFQGMNGQQSAGRGFGSGGGSDAANQQQMQQEMMSQVLGGRRETALKAGQINRQDELNALNASQGLVGQEWDANMGLSAMNLGQMNQNRGQSLNEFLGIHGADEDVLNRNQRTDQFNKSYGLDFLRYLAQKDQFGQTLGENARQYNGTMGFQWNQANQNQQNWLTNLIMGGAGNGQY